MVTKYSESILSQIPVGVWILGFFSMLMDISSEMIHSLLPMFMVTTLGRGRHGGRTVRKPVSRKSLTPATDVAVTTT